MKIPGLQGMGMEMGMRGGVLGGVGVGQCRRMLVMVMGELASQEVGEHSWKSLCSMV